MLTKKRQLRRRKKNNDILSSLGFEISCRCCSAEYKYRSSNIRDESTFEVKIIPFEQNIKKIQKRKIKLKFSELFFIKEKSNEKIIKRKGRKKWTEKHQILLRGGLLLFGEDLEKIHKIIPEFNKRFLKKKINHLYWKKYLLKKDHSQTLELKSNNFNIFEDDNTISVKNEVKIDTNKFEKKNSIFNMDTINTPIFSAFETSPINFTLEKNVNNRGDENLLQNFYNTNDNKENMMRTPIKNRKNFFDEESPNFQNLNKGQIFNYLGIQSTINSLNNSKNNTPFVLKKKRDKLSSIDKENIFFKNENFFEPNKIDEFLF